MSTTAFCDADTMATWIFNWVLGCLLLALLTFFIKEHYMREKQRKRKSERFEYEYEQIQNILSEIKNIQNEARQQFEQAESDHDKAKALYAYEQVEACLKRFKVIEVPKPKQQEAGKG